MQPFPVHRRMEPPYAARRSALAGPRQSSPALAGPRWPSLALPFPALAFIITPIFSYLHLRKFDQGVAFYCVRLSRPSCINIGESPAWPGPLPRRTGMNQQRLFIASCLSLVVTAMIFALRGNVEDLVLTDPALQGFFSETGSRAEYGWLSTMAFFGFASSILVASPMLDGLGMRNLLYLAFGLHIVGIIGFIGAPSYTIMAVASLLAGFGNGLVEAVINPLIATLYPEEKTHKLNVLHAWWPGGLIIAGLLGFALSKFEVSWQIQLGIILVPTIVYGILIFGQKFPLTERVASGISTGEMVRSAMRAAPLYDDHRLDRARAGPDGGLSSGKSGRDERDSDTGLWQCPDVRAALFCRTDCPSNLPDRDDVGLGGTGQYRALFVGERLKRDDGLSRGDGLLCRSMLYVADDAGDHLGAISGGRGVHDGADGICRPVYAGSGNFQYG
ncbi:MAG: MFS transporter [Acidobacteria bacterium]|nr:MFS transporter [Acidobacteriota bacterium]